MQLLQLEDRLVPAISPTDWTSLGSELPGYVTPSPSCDTTADALGPVTPTGNVVAAFSSVAIRYYDGVIRLAAPELSSNGFGSAWAQTISWSNDGGYAAVAGGTNGNGWIDDQFPAMAQVGESSLVVVSNGDTARFFNPADGGGYTEAFFGQDALSHDATNHQYVLTTPDGMTFRFGDFTSYTSTGQQGRLESRTDAYGNLVTVSYTDGLVSEVDRGGDPDGQSVAESWTYQYTDSLLTKVTLRQADIAGDSGSPSWSEVQEVDYTYYGEDDANGNPGDLETATVKDASGNSLGTDYYRYYTSGESGGYVGGLKYYLSAASFDRLTGAGHDPLTATDTQLAPYADDHFEYDSYHRVTEADVQGQGCSACSGGVGTFSYSYTVSSNPHGFNSWAVKTTEGLPDGNENIVYTNAYGEVMLNAFHDTTADTYTDNFYQYDSSGRVTMAAAPSAVSGYDDSYPDLLHNMPGAVGGAETAVNQTTTGDQTNPVVVANATGNSVAAWVSADASGTGIFARRFNPDGTPNGDQFQVNTTTSGNQSGPAVAMAADGSFVVTWCGPDTGSNIFARRFSADGTPLDETEFQVNTTWWYAQFEPQVGYAADGSFVIAWSDSDHGRICAQLYAADGTAVGSELTLNADGVYVYGPRLAVAPDGTFAVGWTDTDFSTYMHFVVRKFNADGTPATDEVVAQSGFWITASGLSLGADGSLLATWETGDSSGTGIYGLVYSPTGTAGTAFLIPSDGYGDQQYQSVAALPGSGWVVAWQDEFADGSGFGIFARDVAADGTPTGDQFQVNVTTSGDQTTVGLSSAPGGFAAVWQSDGQDGDGWGIYTRRFTSKYQYLRDNGGLITNYSYAQTTTASATTAGDVAGYESGESIQQGQLGTPVPQLAETYYHVTSTLAGVPYNPQATNTVYRNDDGTGAETTTYTYTFFSGTAQTETSTVTDPVIDAAQNGSGTADAQSSAYDQYGNVIWTKDAGGFLTQMVYDPLTGATTSETDDVNTSLSGTFTGLPSGWGTTSGLNLTTTMQVDNQGRTIKLTSPAGNVTYTVYDDPDHEVRTYAGWNSTTHMPTGPTTVELDDRTDGYTETLTMSAAPALDGSDLPTGAESIADVQTLSRTYVNAAGQPVTTDDYFNLTGLTDFTLTSLGTEGTNFYRTQQGFDADGRPNRSVSATGTITRTVYNGLGEVISTWVGTDDTPTTGYWSPTNLSGTNMVEVSSDEYDNGGVGDGNLTQETDYPNDGSADRVTDNFYDWRDRLIATKIGVQSTETDPVHRPITYTQFDNLGKAVSQESYNGDGVSISFTDGVPNRPDSSLLRAKTTNSYDDDGRVYQSNVWSVDPSTGDVSTYALHTDKWYDSRGNVMKEADPGGLVTKTTYDGLDRASIVYTTDGGGDAAPGASGSWTDAGSVTGDAVLEQVETTYDDDGNVILTTDRQRFDDETATGALGDPSSTTIAKARVYFTSYYYDAADRPVATVDFGTNPDDDEKDPSTIPSRSNTVLVTTTSYNDAGWASSTVDPMGIESQTYYDALGRTTKTIQDYVDGTPSDDDDKTTEYTYDGDNHLLTYTLLLPSSGQQTTQYNYGVSSSAITSNDLLASVYHPDPSTGAASSSQADFYAYNALGDTTGFTDRNGTTHAYGFDVLGRPTSDTVTTLGSGVDNSVLRLTTAYDSQGNPYLLTSYSTTSGTSGIVNQVLRQYNGLGQLTAEYEEQSGAVNTSTTLPVTYTYTEMAGGANNSRLTSMTGGWPFDYLYGTSGSLDDRISRLEGIEIDDSNWVETFSYLGVDTVVQKIFVTANIKLTYIGSGTGDGGDKYVGLDRFGRIVDQHWVTSGDVDVVNYQYGYDRDGDRLYQKDLVNSSMSEIYTYDDLNQLTSFERGALNSTDTAITGTPSATESYDLDAAGNFSSVTTGSGTVTRTTNAQNEVTAVGSSSLGYDNNGNTTTDDQGHTLVYDAWNRLVKVKSGSTVIAGYTYDAASRRNSETHSGTTTDLYLSSSDQVVLEVTASTSTYVTYLWDPLAVDEPVLRIVDTSSGETQMYALTTANGDVAAVVDTTGPVEERYEYDPYGQVTFLSSSYGSPSSSSAIGWEYLHQGLRWDSVVDLYDNLAREYSPTLMRFLQNDPIGFVAGSSDLYATEKNNPYSFTDPTGQDAQILGKRIRAAGKIADLDAQADDGSKPYSTIVGKVITKLNDDLKAAKWNLVFAIPNVFWFSRKWTTPGRIVVKGECWLSIARGA